MKQAFLKLSFLVFLFNISTILFAQNSIEGNWFGVIKIMGTELRLSYTITNVDGELKASMASIDQGVSGIPMEKVVLKDHQLSIVQGEMMLEYSGVVNEGYTEIEGVYRQAGQEFEMNLGRKPIEKKTIKRPQEPKAPFNYYIEDVSYENKKADITLAGTLTLPSKEGKYPVVILISGSGAQDRNEELLGHKPFLVLADYLTKNGIGVLRFDDRGTAKSTGSHSSATSADFATDVEAAVDFLKKRKDIDKKKIGLMGHSEGGLIAPMVATNRNDIAFIVLLAGPGVAGDQILLEQGRLIALAEGGDIETVEANAIEAKTLYDIIKNNPQDSARIKLTEFVKTQIEKLPEEQKNTIPDIDAYINSKVSAINNVWFRFFLSYNPYSTIKKVKCPVLAINGMKDLQVPYEVNLKAIESALIEGGNASFKTVALPKLNHLFQTTETGALSEYGELEETFSPKALLLIKDWLVEIVK